MSGVDFVNHPWAQVALATGLLLPLQGAAQLSSDSRTAPGSFTVSITVKPEFRVLESRAVNGGYVYRVWTNMKSIHLRGQDYSFARVGEATVMVPGELLAGDLLERALGQPAQAQRAANPLPDQGLVPPRQGS